MKLELPTIPRATSQAAKILNVRLVEADQFTYATGTVEWLLYQGVHIEFTVLQDSDLPFYARIARVVVGEMDVIVACEGAVPVDLENSQWMPRMGVHDIDLELNDAGGSVLTRGAPLSSGALENLHAIVAHAQREFRAAVDDREAELLW
jgi:hypothetical protein